MHPNVARVVEAGREVWAAAGTPHVNFAVDPRRLAEATGGAVADVTRD